MSNDEGPGSDSRMFVKKLEELLNSDDGNVFSENDLLNWLDPRALELAQDDSRQKDPIAEQNGVQSGEGKSEHTPNWASMLLAGAASLSLLDTRFELQLASMILEQPLETCSDVHDRNIIRHLKYTIWPLIDKGFEVTIIANASIVFFFALVNAAVLAVVKRYSSKSWAGVASRMRFPSSVHFMASSLYLGTVSARWQVVSASRDTSLAKFAIVVGTAYSVVCPVVTLVAGQRLLNRMSTKSITQQESYGTKIKYIGWCFAPIRLWSPYHFSEAFASVLGWCRSETLVHNFVHLYPYFVGTLCAEALNAASGSAACGQRRAFVAVVLLGLVALIFLVRPYRTAFSNFVTLVSVVAVFFVLVLNVVDHSAAYHTKMLLMGLISVMTFLRMLNQGYVCWVSNHAYGAIELKQLSE